ncbi:MAG TPA: hypothetical protein VJ508_11475, partial [Saprospiraceae bacterium]|nr:hypothetical protein [Saprospiraceae bacterium]
RKKSNDDRRLGVDEVADHLNGFMILDENHGREVVVGAIGQFWHLKIPFNPIPADRFASYHTPGWGKVAWAITVEPYLEGSTISFELRTTATDEDSWKKLSQYFKLIGFASHLIRESVMHHLEAQLKKMKFAHDDETHFPADGLIPEASHTITFHKNIEAPPSLVWSYLMQLGCDRAGWYSIDLLDHDGRPSIDHIVSDWPPRQEGDKLAATPAMNSFYEVYKVKKEKWLVIGGETQRLGGPFKMTWSFILTPMGSDATHLVSRARMIASPKWAEWVMGNLVYPPLHWLMSKAQLNTIKQLAERDAQARPAAQLIPEYENQ